MGNSALGFHGLVPLPVAQPELAARVGVESSPLLEVVEDAPYSQAHLLRRHTPKGMVTRKVLSRVALTPPD